MTDLQVRRVRFDFSGEEVPFNWQPERPAFAMQCNVISFFALGFEKFIVDATREAIPLMRDPEAAEEANAYLRQEAQHLAAHVSHVRALSRRWPGLQETMHKVTASFDHPHRDEAVGVAACLSRRGRSDVHAVLQGFSRPRGQVVPARR
jgi:predicted metal-dependent hydrolase